jgi:hypothetical protein
MPRKHYTFDKASYHERRYNRQRQFAYDYLGNKCSICGSQKGLVFSPRVQEIPPKRKRSIVWGTHQDKLIEQLDESVLLCNECFGKRISKAKGGYRHGTYYSSGKLKCECDICVTFREEYNARRVRAAEKRRRVLSGRKDRAFNPAA